MLWPLAGLVVVATLIGLGARLRLRRRSRFMLGAERSAEEGLRVAAGIDDLRRFFVLSQRLLWGLTQPDLIRVDHFRGFAAYWEIAADEPTAMRRSSLRATSKLRAVCSI